MKPPSAVPLVMGYRPFLTAEENDVALLTTESLELLLAVLFEFWREPYVGR